METLTPDKPICPHCGLPIESSAFYCPACGKNVREKPLSTGIGTQIGLYIASFLLPPLFLWWTIKYLKSADRKTKRIGMISLGLTIIALIIAVWLSITFVINVGSEVNQQLNQYQELGL